MCPLDEHSEAPLPILPGFPWVPRPGESRIEVQPAAEERLWRPNSSRRRPMTSCLPYLPAQPANMAKRSSGPVRIFGFGTSSRKRARPGQDITLQINSMRAVPIFSEDPLFSSRGPSSHARGGSNLLADQRRSPGSVRGSDTFDARLDWPWSEQFLSARGMA